MPQGRCRCRPAREPPAGRIHRPTSSRRLHDPHHHEASSRSCRHCSSSVAPSATSSFLTPVRSPSRLTGADCERAPGCASACSMIPPYSRSRYRRRRPAPSSLPTVTQAIYEQDSTFARPVRSRRTPTKRGPLLARGRRRRRRPPPLPLPLPPASSSFPSVVAIDRVILTMSVTDECRHGGTMGVHPGHDLLRLLVVRHV